MLAFFCLMASFPVNVKADSNTQPTGAYSTYGSAQQIPGNTMVSDTLSDTNTVHYYKFTATQNGYFTVNFAQQNGRGRWNFAIYDADHDVQELESGKAVSSYTSGNYNFAPGRSIYIRVERISVSVGDYNLTTDQPYELTVKTTAAYDWEQEDNDTQETATVLQNGEWLNGSTYKESDTDWYTYTIPSTGYFTYEFQGVSDCLEGWQVYLYDQNMKELEKNVAAKNITSKKYTIPVGQKVYIRITCKKTGAQYKIRSSYYATDAWEQEVNDTREQANILTTGQEISGNNPSGDTDWFVYTIPASGYFVLKFQGMDNSYSTWNVYVYDEKLNLLESSRNALSFTSGRYTFPVGEKVYVKVNNGFGSQYKLCPVFTETSDWETESNDTIAQATVMENGQMIHGTINRKGDVDFYQYTAAGQGYFSIQFTNVDGGENQFWKLSLYDEKKKLLQTAETGDDLETTLARMSFRKGRKVYLKVERNINDYACGHEYAVTVSQVNAKNWEQESNDSMKTATVLKKNQTCKANSYSVRDKDYFVYKAVKKGKVTLQVTLPESGYWQMLVYDQNKKLISDKVDYDYIQSRQKFTVSLKKGQKVYVMIKARTQSSMGKTYQITAKQK